MMGSGLQRRVLGIVGLEPDRPGGGGAALAFGMTVHAYDPTPPGNRTSR
jgi:hypothetical protein